MFNLCVILAVLSIIKPVKFLKETVRKDMHMTVVTAFVLLVLMADTIIGSSTVNMLSRADGLILLVLFGIFIYYTLFLVRYSFCYIAFYFHIYFANNANSILYVKCS